MRVYGCLPSENFAHHVLQSSNVVVSKRQPFVKGVKKRAVRSFLGFSIELPLGGFTLGTKSVGNRNEGSD